MPSNLAANFGLGVLYQQMFGQHIGSATILGEMLGTRRHWANVGIANTDIDLLEQLLQCVLSLSHGRMRTRWLRIAFVLDVPVKEIYFGKYYWK